MVVLEGAKIFRIRTALRRFGEGYLAGLVLGKVRRSLSRVFAGAKNGTYLWSLYLAIS
jgi:hypothetical protein